MKRARSTAYPVLDLAAAYRILRQDLEDLGAAELDRDEIARKLGYNDALGGLVARKIGALVHYGLLVRRGSRYGLSPLGLRLQNLDIHDTEFPSAIRAALEHPVLFRAILDRHRATGRVPHSLAAELESFGITEKASADAEEVFRSSALFAGVIDTEGTFSSGHASSSPTLPALEEQRIEPLSGAQESEGIPLLLPRGKKAFLVLPKSFDGNDYVALKESFLATYRILPGHLEIEIPKRVEGNTQGKAKSSESGQTLPFEKRKKRPI